MPQQTRKSDQKGTSSKKASEPKEQKKTIRICTTDFFDNHRHHCEGDGRRRERQDNGVYACCRAVAEPDMEYVFKREPSNPYDRNAVEIRAGPNEECGGEKLGYVPREDNELVGDALKDKKVRVFGQRGDCGRLFSVAVMVEGPAKWIDEKYAAEESESF